MSRKLVSFLRSQSVYLPRNKDLLHYLTPCMNNKRQTLVFILRWIIFSWWLRFLSFLVWPLFLHFLMKKWKHTAGTVLILAYNSYITISIYLIWYELILLFFLFFFCRRSLVIIMHYFHWSLLVSVLVSQTHNQAWTLCMISKCSQGWKTHFERWDNIFAQQIKYWSHEQYSRLLALKFQLEDHSVRYMFTSRYKFWTRNIVVNKFVCGQHLRYFCQIVTDLGFVFTTVVLHSETVGGTKFHKMPISTSCYINMRYKIN